MPPLTADWSWTNRRGPDVVTAEKVVMLYVSLATAPAKHPGRLTLTASHHEPAPATASASASSVPFSIPERRGGQPWYP